MTNKFKNKKEKEKNIAQDRIKGLFEQANAVFSKNSALSNRYVSIARKIASRTRNKIPKTLKRSFCKHCGSYLQPGKNVKIRLNKGKKSYLCMTCGKTTRVLYK